MIISMIIMMTGVLPKEQVHNMKVSRQYETMVGFVCHQPDGDDVIGAEPTV